MNDRIETIRQRLQECLSPSECRLEDESALHAGHPGAASGGGHYRLNIVAAQFEGMPRIARHRLVYDCLADLLQREIHALAITAVAPSELNGTATV